MPSSEKLKKQFDYLRKLKKMSFSKLRTHYREQISDTPYKNTKMVKAPRAEYEKRCFYLFCMRNYHYEKNTSPRIMFFKLAKSVLLKDWEPLPKDQERERTRKLQYSQTQLFTKNSINSMPIVAVERYLTEFGIYVDIPNKDKRRLLWELHRLPASKLPKTLNENGEVVSPRGLDRTRLNNQYCLRDIILENPSMTYNEFIERWGDKMPQTSRNSFKVTRSQLKKAGYALPDLRIHGQAVTRNGKVTPRGRILRYGE